MQRVELKLQCQTAAQFYALYREYSNSTAAKVTDPKPSSGKIVQQILSQDKTYIEIYYSQFDFNDVMNYFYNIASRIKEYKDITIIFIGYYERNAYEHFINTFGMIAQH